MCYYYALENYSSLTYIMGNNSNLSKFRRGKVLEISGKGPGVWAQTLTRESGPGSAKVVRVRGRKSQ